MIQDTLRNRIDSTRIDRDQEFKTHLPEFHYFPFGGGIRGCTWRIICVDGRNSCHSNIGTKMGNAKSPSSARQIGYQQ